MPRILPLLVMSMAMAACSNGPPQITGQSPPGVSFRLQGESTADAGQRADHYCQQYGKRAQLSTVEHQGEANIAVYQCS